MDTLFQINSFFVEKVPPETFHLTAHYIRRLVDDTIHDFEVLILCNIANKVLYDATLEPVTCKKATWFNSVYVKEGELLERLEWKLHHHSRYDVVLEYAVKKYNMNTLTRQILCLLKLSEHSTSSDAECVDYICECIDTSFVTPTTTPTTTVKKRTFEKLEHS
jgi:hypothetical protein